MLKGLSEALKGVNGGYELNRLIGAFGGFVFIVSTVVFVGHDVIYKGKEFDLVAYCLSFPGGIAVVAGCVAGAVAIKDTFVARAKITEQTGAVPVAPPAGPSVEPKELGNEN